MSFTPEPGTPLEVYYARTQPRTGAVLSRRSLGTLDRVSIGRYALTIGATDPAHYDPAAALAAGYADVVAPPNMLAATAEWGGRHTRGPAPARRASSRWRDTPR
jgi:hypothetical protein